MIGCKPTLLTASSSIKDQTWEINLPAEGAEEDSGLSNLVITTPTFDQDPECNYEIEYTANGLTSWIQYDSGGHTMTLDWTKANNGTYEFEIIGTLSEDSVNVELTSSETFSLEVTVNPYVALLEEVLTADNSTDIENANSTTDLN